jgi:hypothetical protein
MVSRIHVKAGLEFKKDLYQADNKKPWLEAAGAELEKKNVALRLGDGAGAVEIRTAGELVAFFEAYEADPAGMAGRVGLPQGTELDAYVADMIQALDDVVKFASDVQSGDVIDFSTRGELSKTLGIDSVANEYAAAQTDFGNNAPPSGAMNVLGIQLQRNAAKADPLEGVPHMTAATFEGTPMTGRESQEFETVKRLNGMSSSDVLGFVRGERAGRPILNRIRKASDHAAFSLGYSGIDINEMDWSGRAHRTREMNPLISLTVESGRMEWDEDDGEFEVSQGTDYFHDRYYTAKDPNRPGVDLLGETGNMVRARIRYDNPGEARRLLIQSKSGSEVDENGMKQAAKADIRKDSPSADDIENLDRDARNGTTNWSWGTDAKPIEALNNVYQDMKEKDALPDVGPHEDVLMLDIGAHIFSTRSRYHLNETNSRSVQAMFDNGDAVLATVGGLLEQSQDLSGMDLDRLKQLHGAIVDKSAIVERARDGLAALDPSLSSFDVNADTVTALWPKQGRPADKMEVKKRRVVADAIREAYGELAEALDDARLGLSGSDMTDARDFDFETEAMDFIRSKNSNLKEKTTWGPFLQHLDEKLAGPDKDAFIDEFANWLNTQTGDSRLLNAPDKDAAMAGLRKNMVREHIEILHRQLEASGTAGQALWFDGARATYANASRRTSNFLIDTFDFVTNIRPSDWGTLTPEQRDGREPIPDHKIYNADVIAEVQIELGYEEPYLNALAASRKALDGARAGFFMDHALSRGLGGVVASDPASFAAAMKEVLAQSTWDQDNLVSDLNSLAQSRGSPVRFDRESLGRLGQELFTSDRQNQSTDGHGALMEDHEMNSFIWDTITGAQESIADLRGTRVLREAQRAGFSGVSWDDSDKSKGETALTHPDL